MNLRNFTVLLCLVLLLVGCPKKRGLDVQPVQGIITVDGQTHKRVRITFTPVDTDSIEKAYAETNDKGVYKLTSTNGDLEKGAVVGDYRISISWPETDKFRTIGGLQFPTYEERLLDKYTDPETSGLTATVKRGRNTFNFDLESKP